MPPSYIRVRAVVWAYGRGQTLTQRIRGFTTMRYINLRFTYLLTYLHTDKQTDTQMRMTTIHFASSTTHAKCNKQGTDAVRAVPRLHTWVGRCFQCRCEIEALTLTSFLFHICCLAMPCFSDCAAHRSVTPLNSLNRSKSEPM